MSSFDPDPTLSREELAWELVEVFDALRTEEINEILAKNVPMETLRFFAAYADDFSRSRSVEGEAAKQLPNLLLLGYLLRVLEDRLIGDDSYDA